MIDKLQNMLRSREKGQLAPDVGRHLKDPRLMGDGWPRDYWCR